MSAEKPKTKLSPGGAAAGPVASPTERRGPASPSGSLPSFTERRRPAAHSAVPEPPGRGPGEDPPAVLSQTASPGAPLSPAQDPALDLAAASAPTRSAAAAGRVKHDARGNAVWEWAISTGAFSGESSTQRLKKLDDSALSLAEDAPTPVDVARPNPLGTVNGYSPYDSGLLGRREAPRKKDLRKLSEWLKLKKQAGTKPDDES